MITIMTPTYNRADLLKRLYESIIKQGSGENFEWLVVDDGSTDDTGKIIKEFIAEKKISITYLYQENAGKAKAFNSGVRNAKGDLFLCVDSDDFLEDNAVDRILKCSDRIKNEDVAGIIALKKDIDGILLSDMLPQELEYETTFRLSELYKCGGEWSLIYKTDVLRNCLFPEIAGEKFVTECVIYDRIAQKYKMLLLNEVVTVCEYQQDGLTKNIVENMLKNPTGYKIFYGQRIDMAYTLKERLGYAVRYNAFCRLSNDFEYNYRGKHVRLVKALGVMGIIGKWYYVLKARKKISV